VLRPFAIFLVAVVVSGGASAQNVQKEVRQARPGESCVKSYEDCGRWCSQNRPAISDNLSCRDECTRYQGVCRQTGVWSTPLGKVEIRGLPTN
jgi:hypothetical protein